MHFRLAKTKLTINVDWAHLLSVWKIKFKINLIFSKKSKLLKMFQCWFKVERKDADNITTELMLAINVKMKNSPGR